MKIDINMLITLAIVDRKEGVKGGDEIVLISYAQPE